jgi:hypothetical protein
MKKLTLIAIALVAMAATFTSCKKDTTTPAPTISFNNVTGDAVSVNNGESYTVNADLVASAKFKTVTYTVAYGSTSNTYNVQWGSNDTAFHFTTTISNITIATTVTISVTDKNDINTSKTLTITVGAAALTDYNSVGIIGAGGNLTYGSYIDLDNGQVYTHSDVINSSSIAASIDAVFDQSSLFNTGNGITGSTGTTFGSTTLNSTAFASANESTLTGLTATSSSIAISQGDVIYFQTISGNKGLILIKTLGAESTPGANDRTITIEIKIKKS